MIIIPTGSFFHDNLLLRVAMGHGNGSSIVNKFGRNPDVDTTAPEDVWDGGGTYTYPSTANYVYLSSTSSSDAGLATRIQGLDENWDLVEEDIELDSSDPSLTAVQTSAKYIRVFRMYNVSDTNYTGEIYCGSTSSITSGVPNDTIYAKISLISGGSTNQTLMAMYTIPNGYYGYLIAWDFDNSNDRETFGGIWKREYGGVFRVMRTHGMYRFFLKNNMYYEPLSPKTDIKVRALATLDDTKVSSNFTILLVPESQVEN